jgi:putative oxidoreductase
MTEIYDNITARLRTSGDWVWPFLLRLILFWEFWSAGMTKYNGKNWFANIEDKFPFPLSTLSADLNWLVATWGELVFSMMLLLGLFTRFAAFSLIVFTAVAIVSVHWPSDWSSLAELWKGYAISDKGFGNFRVPLLFTLMLLPLVFNGGGKFSLDFILLKVMGRDAYVHDRISDLAAAGWAFVVLGLPVLMVVPAWGITLLVLGLACFLVPALMK